MGIGGPALTSRIATQIAPLESCCYFYFKRRLIHCTEIHTALFQSTHVSRVVTWRFTLRIQRRKRTGPRDARCDRTPWLRTCDWPARKESGPGRAASSPMGARARRFPLGGRARTWPKESRASGAELRCAHGATSPWRGSPPVSLAAHRTQTRRAWSRAATERERSEECAPRLQRRGDA